MKWRQVMPTLTWRLFIRKIISTHMSLDSRQGPTIEIGPLGTKPNQLAAITSDEGVRRMLGMIARKTFASNGRGLPVSSLFELRSGDPEDGGEDEVLHGEHLLVSGDIEMTEHVVHAVPVEYPDDETEYIGDPEDVEDLVREANEATYILESNFDEDADVVVDNHDDVLALERLIEAAYRDERA